MFSVSYRRVLVSFWADWGGRQARNNFLSPSPLVPLGWCRLDFAPLWPHLPPQAISAPSSPFVVLSPLPGPYFGDSVWCRKQSLFSKGSSTLHTLSQHIFKNGFMFSTLRLEHKAAFACWDHLVIPPSTPALCKTQFKAWLKAAHASWKTSYNFKGSLRSGERQRRKKMTTMTRRPYGAQQINGKNDFWGVLNP